jgi:hypothetical protein
MKRKKINKNLLILLLLVAILSIFYFYNRSLKPVFFVTDKQYYSTTVKKQERNLKYLALKNKERLEIVEVERLNSPLSKILEDDASLVIMSPLVSYCYNKGSSKIENPYISIGYDTKDTNGFKATVDENNDGWVECAIQLKEKGFPLYLISDKSWPLSLQRAKVFFEAYGPEGITVEELDGDEMKQYALSLIEKIKEEGINTVVFTGSSFIGDFVNNDKTLGYVIPASLDEVVTYSQINKVVYTNLSPLFDNAQREGNAIILHQGVWDFQEGLKNYLIQSWKFLVSKCF